MTLIRGPDDTFSSSETQAPPVVDDGAATVPVPVVRLRRRWWIIVAIVAAVLVVVIPLAVAAMLDRDDGIGQPAAPVLQPTPSQTTGAPTGTPTQPGSAAVPVGGIPSSELLNGTFDIPAWPADTGWPDLAAMVKQVKFTNGTSKPLPDGRHLTIGQVRHADVNRDGRAETLGLISMIVQGTIQQVAAFTRDASGAIVPFGQVVVTHPGGTVRDAKIIDTYRPGGNGTVDVRVGDDVPCCGVEPEYIQYQWRTYAWTGSAFKQVAGPTEFGRDLRFPDLVIKAGPLNLGAPVNGVRHGVLTVTVSSTGTVRGREMMLGFQLREPGLTPEGSGWEGFTDVGGVWQGNRVPPSVGRSVTLQFGVSRPASMDGTAADHFWVSGSPEGKDAWQADNAVSVSIVLA